ncbi:MAG: beta-lactamase family protein, partial [Salibacteraceae bacterium]|nr:beta-lactamase family protein [Salibacteraceae bacterium]
MKMKTGKTIKSGILILFTSISLTSCQLGRFVYYNFANITDYKIFPSRALLSDSASFKFQTTEKGKSPKELDGVPFDKYLKESKTVAFLIIKNDTIQYEKYFNGYERESIVASFSMAKSVSSILIGCAIDEGLITSVNEPITKYIPELTEAGFEKVKIKHLLQMTSGID